MVQKEIIEFGIKALPPSFKQAIEWGSGYHDKKAVENYIDWAVSVYLFDADMGAILKRYLYIDAQLEGLAVFEDSTRDSGLERYLAVSQIGGVKVHPDGTMEPQAEEKGRKWNSVYHSLYADKNWHKLENILYKSVLNLRKSTRLVKAQKGDREMIIPEWLHIMYLNIFKIQVIQQEANADAWRWDTRKNMMKEARDIPFLQSLQDNKRLLQNHQQELIRLHQEKFKLQMKEDEVERKKTVLKEIRKGRRKRLKQEVGTDGKIKKGKKGKSKTKKTKQSE